MPKISIIIPVYNGAKTLSGCVESLMQLDFPREEREIIVVDNNSTDNSKEIISRYPVKYVFEPIRGRGKARNAGIKASSGQYIAFTDSDCVVDKNWLKELVRGFDSEDIAACGGKIAALRTENWIEEYFESRQTLGQEKAIIHDRRMFFPRIVTANAMFRRDILERIGYFDEDLITCEDTEIGWQITLHGFRLKYVPEALIYHRHINRLWSLCLHQLEFGNASYMTMKKYGFLPDNFFSKFIYSLSSISNLIQIQFRFIYSLVSDNKEKKKFIFLDCLIRTFLVLGSLRTSLKDTFLPEYLVLTKRRCLSNNFYNDFQISYNDHRWVFNKSVFWFLDGGIVKLFDFKSFSSFRLNYSGTLIWQGLLELKDAFRAAEALSQKLSIPKEIALRDVKDLMDQMEKEAILIRN